ncbi:MAG TPA: glycosyltransferase family 4 protein [Candidatus Saccharimonadales bacterium]|nr:glycosyltransferase family 4 protein [Candidatus Saccharimonadales bacterium]
MASLKAAKHPTPKLKIGFVLDDSLDSADGVQQYVLTVGTWLKKQGHEVHYLVGETVRTDIENLHSLSRNVKVRFNHNRMSMPLPAQKTQLRKLLQQEQFDILHVQLPYSPFLAGRIIAAAPARTAIVGTFHIAPHSRMVHLANRLLMVLTRRTLRRFDAIFSVSPVAQAFAKQTFGIESSVLPNTVSMAAYDQPEPLAKYIKTTNIMFLGRLVQRKGCAHLLRAVAEMQRQNLVNSPYKVVICGKGPLEPELREFVRSHSLQDIVVFEGFIDETEKPNYLATSDIAVFPSTGGESFGIVLIEAMAASRGAVLAGNNPGYASVMEPFTQSLFNPADEQALAHLLANMLNDSKKRAQLSMQQHIAVRQYDIGNVGTRLVNYYEVALHKRRP